MYVIVGVREPSAETPKPTPRPSREPALEPPTEGTPKPTPRPRDTPDCPWIVEPLEDLSRCPKDLDIKNCAHRRPRGGR